MFVVRNLRTWYNNLEGSKIQFVTLLSHTLFLIVLLVSTSTVNRTLLYLDYGLREVLTEVMVWSVPFLTFLLVLLGFMSSVKSWSPVLIIIPILSIGCIVMIISTMYAWYDHLYWLSPTYEVCGVSQEITDPVLKENCLELISGYYFLMVFYVLSILGLIVQSVASVFRFRVVKQSNIAYTNTGLDDIVFSGSSDVKLD